MTYREWYREFGARHRKIVEGLEGWEPEAIVEYFRYDNMRERHPDFCPLYAEGKRCHEIEDLNCYLCGCPHFRYCNEGIDRVDGKTRFSLCAIEAKEGRAFETDTAIHQDCSGCPLPHLRGFILKHFDGEWSRIMKGCERCGE
jgi:hypothetical protein